MYYLDLVTYFVENVVQNVNWIFCAFALSPLLTDFMSYEQALTERKPIILETFDYLNENKPENKPVSEERLLHRTEARPEVTKGFIDGAFTLTKNSFIYACEKN